MANPVVARTLGIRALLDSVFTARLPDQPQRQAPRRWNHNAEVLRQSAHSRFVNVRNSQLEVRIMPVLRNNYMYLVIDLATCTAAAIDPVEPDLISSEVIRDGLKLKAAFITHHHSDHAAGNAKLAELYPHIPICAGDKRIKAVNKYVRDREKFPLGRSTVLCLHTPCHTAGHYCYFVQPCKANEGVLFTGDTLFQAGCGPFMEGTAQEMYENVQLFYTLPEKTKVFGGHENTVANLRFALNIEPTNEDTCARLTWAQQRRGVCLPTPPSTLFEECLWNPFMRVTMPQVLKYSDDVDPVQAMLFLRKKRDKFR